MADCEVKQFSSGDWLMAKSLPSTEVVCSSDKLPSPVLVQTLPELLHPCLGPGDQEPLQDLFRHTPSILVILAPGATVHDSSKIGVELLIIPKIDKIQNFSNYI